LFTVKSSLASGSGEWGSHKARQKIEKWAKQGRVIKADSRWHLQDMKLLPKSPLCSSPLGRGTGRGTGRGRGYFEESDPKQDLFSEKEQRGRRVEEEGERERERTMHLLMQKNGDPSLNHPLPNPHMNPTPEPLTKQQITREKDVLTNKG
jgi:hypothetical protein